MPIGQGDLDDDKTQEAAQSGADCAKAARCRRDAQFWKELAAVLQALEVSESTYARWRSQYGGMKAEEAVRLKKLEEENKQLKDGGELTLDNQMLKFLKEGNW